MKTREKKVLDSNARQGVEYSYIMATTCKTCKVRKPNNQFKNKHGAIVATCLMCRNVHLKKVELRKILVKSLGRSARGKCSICGEAIQVTGRGMAIDHDHKTGKIRGILCKGCNVAIGWMKDNPDVAYKAATYLESHLN